MKKREIIIVVIAALLGVYGLVDYFILSGSAAPGDDKKITDARGSLDAFAKSAELTLGSAVTQGALKDQTYMIAKAEAPWEKDPFGENGLGDLKDEEGVAKEDSLEMHYSGFIQAGRKILAVVNGMEYTVGEQLVDAGYKVSKITSSKVVLLTEANKEIVLQLEEN